LAEKRSKLNILVNNFLRDARQYLPCHSQRDSASLEDVEDNEEPVASSLEEQMFNGLVKEERHPTQWNSAQVALEGDEIGEAEAELGSRAVRSVDPDGELPPEQVKIPLPSSFGAEVRQREGWATQTRVELDQRAGRQRDHLNDVREYVALKGFTYAHDWRLAKTQGAMTRSRTRLNGIMSNIRNASASYSMSRMIYSAMGGAGTDTEFRELKPDDVKGVRSYIDHTIRGRTHETASWIWTLGTHENDYFGERVCFF
jgi:hypothetical protein